MRSPRPPHLLEVLLQDPEDEHNQGEAHSCTDRAQQVTKWVIEQHVDLEGARLGSLLDMGTVTHPCLLSFRAAGRVAPRLEGSWSSDWGTWVVIAAAKDGAGAR